ncbi:hypothetical protein Tsubulata_042563 [Turnera subulata]|uniref:Uncharacterized protein n=1 Tax=Turnera subulata TaxID=218843 RepID=A0A9Q0G1H6_9ROSI|nr:hypothetical protein Tsubulata_042563 [Turnera subulata]
MAVATQSWNLQAIQEGLRGGEEGNKRQRRIIYWNCDVSGNIDGFSAGGWPIADIDFWRFGPDLSDFDYTHMYCDSDEEEEDSSEDSDSDSDSGPSWYLMTARRIIPEPDAFSEYPEGVREEVRRYFEHFIDECKYFGKITADTPKLLFELSWLKSDHKVFPIFPVPNECHPSLAKHITWLEILAKEALRRYNDRMLQNLVFEELVRANVWERFPVDYFITFLVNDGSSTCFRCQAHVSAPSAPETWKVRLFALEKDGLLKVHIEAPCIREMPAQSEKAAIPCHSSNHKRHMEFEALKGKCLKDKAVILQAKSHVSDHMVLCPSKAIRYEGGATGYRYEADTFAEMLAGDRPYASHESDIIKKCAEAAVKYYNEKMVADYKMESIKVAGAIHSQASGVVSSFISFDAKDECDGVESLFRARVIHDENWDGGDAFRVDIVVRGLNIGAYPWKCRI